MTFLGVYIATRNKKSKTVGFSADSVLKFSAQIDVFIKFFKKLKFFAFFVDYLVQCCPEKAILM